jgi:hypothetical protein
MFLAEIIFQVMLELFPMIYLFCEFTFFILKFILQFVLRVF